MTAEEIKIFEIHNEIRQKFKKPALNANQLLNQTARDHSDWMARTGRMSHHQGKGATIGYRVGQFGYEARGWAENIATGQDSPQEVMTSWMNSSGHRRNILKRELVDVGIAVSENERGQKYYTAVFAIPRTTA